jgi:WD40 repeat protein
VGRYIINRVIGHGGFGAVYEAHVAEQPQIRIAVKESLEPGSLSTFQSEFALLNRLRHDHLPRYYELLEANGNAYLVMEFIPGQSLADVLFKHQEPLLERQVLGYVLQICDVLGYLHGQRPPLIHRDIKPANIRLTPEGLVKLVDFGLTKQGVDVTHISRRGFTPDYAPPEQWGMSSGQHTDPRSDIYSLGATLYHLLTGRRPSSAALRLADTKDPLRSPQEYNSRLSQNIADAILKAMELKREQRYSEISAFKLALLGISPQDPPAAPVTNTTVFIRPRSHVPLPKRRLGPRMLAPRPVTNIQQVGTLKANARGVTSLAWSPDGKLLASTGFDDQVLIWRVPGEKLVYTLQGHEDYVSGVSWSPDGQMLASSSADGTIRLWRTTTMSMEALLQGHTSRVTSVAWSPDGNMLASGSFDATVRLWRRADYCLSRVLDGLNSQVYCVSWSPDGKRLAQGSGYDILQVWRVANGEPLQKLHGEIGFVKSVAWSPDGKLLASVGGNRVQLWLVAESVLLHSLRGHSYGIDSVTWNPDGQVFASAGTDSTVRIWNMSAGKELFTLQEHIDHVTCVAWSPDGNTVASGSADGIVQLWRVIYR